MMASSFVDSPLLDEDDSAAGADHDDNVSGAVSDITNGLFARRDVAVEALAPMASFVKPTDNTEGECSR